MIAMALMTAMSVSAQIFAQEPMASMQSTSVMAGSGSSLAAPANPVMASAPVDNYTTTPGGGPRRVGESDGFEEEDDPTNPGQPFPIGDAPLWLMAALMGAYAAWRKRCRGTAAHTKAK